METYLNINTLTYSASEIRHRWIKAKPELCVILQTSGEDAIRQLEIVKEIPYVKMNSPHFGDISERASKLIWARVGGKDVFVFLGRHHFYEGNGWEPVILPIFISHFCGAGKLLSIGTAGGITIEPLSTILVRDHINLMGSNPLIGAHNPEFGPRFPTMTNAYDAGLSRKVKEACDKNGEKTIEGVLAGLTGPCFDTEAEIRMMKSWGADAVAMNTIPEAIFAKSLGMKTVALSSIVNYAAGIGKEPLSINEIIHNTDVLVKKGFKMIPKAIEAMLE